MGFEKWFLEFLKDVTFDHFSFLIWDIAKITFVTCRYILQLSYDALKHKLKWFISKWLLVISLKVVHAKPIQIGHRLWAIEVTNIEISRNLFCKLFSQDNGLEGLEKNFFKNRFGFLGIWGFRVLHLNPVTL